MPSTSNLVTCPRLSTEPCTIDAATALTIAASYLAEYCRGILKGENCEEMKSPVILERLGHEPSPQNVQIVRAAAASLSGLIFRNQYGEGFTEETIRLPLEPERALLFISSLAQGDLHRTPKFDS